MAFRRLWHLNIGLLLLGTVVAVFWVYLIGGREFFTGLTQIPSGHILVLPGLTGVWIFVRFIRWQFLLRSVGVRVPIRESFAIYLASLPGTATPAYVGEVMRSVFMRRTFGIPIRITTAVLVVERLLDVVALGIIVITMTYDAGVRETVLLLLLVALVATFLASWLVRRVAVSLTIVKQLNWSVILLQTVVLSLIAWVSASFLVTFAAASIDIHVPLLDGMRVFSTATLLGGITLMPAGIGVTGSSAILLLQGLGIALADAVVVVSLVRVMSTGLALSIGTVFLFRQFRVMWQTRDHNSNIHFDAIAREYDQQFSEHVWNHLRERRIGLITGALPDPPPNAGIGLDLGCGLGRQCVEMGKRGYRVIGIDAAHQLAQQGHMAGATVTVGDALKLPFGDESFGFVYVIGVLHHLSNMDVQVAACREVARILKPGGLFIVHETNPRNPLFRFYMGYIFPILKSIDEGTEWWSDPSRWERLDGLKLLDLRYYTFLPDFIPSILMRLGAVVERFLETSPLRTHAAHYVAFLEKTSPQKPYLAFDIAKPKASQDLAAYGRE